jgi:predicted Zn-dependent protease
MATGWIDGLIDSSIETAEVNAMPAATATASAGEWKFRLAVIRFEPDRLYRLIFATRVSTEDAKQRFQASIDSFHHVSADEVKAVRPLRLAITVAKAGETADALAAQMAVPDRALDYFLLINELARGEPLHRGVSYKIVVE